MKRISSHSFARIGRIVFVAALLIIGTWQLQSTMSPASDATGQLSSAGNSPAAEVLSHLAVKGRAPKTGYSREMFSSGWGEINGCDLRNYILARDMQNVVYVENSCKVQSGTLQDPYTNTLISFTRGAETSSVVQIDHVVALSDAWQKGAQQLTSAHRFGLANDPLNLLAVDGRTNQDKGDGDAASWLPPNKLFRCSYVARQIAVKKKYLLWVTTAEYQAIAKVLTTCPTQELPIQ